MVKEAYCSYEVSKLLKKKGFDIRCHSHYWSQDKDNSRWQNLEQNWNCASEDWYSRPTHQLAMAWLREEKRLFIEISVSVDLNGDYHYLYSILDKECKYIRKRYTSFEWNYEEAVEAAFLYVLQNLI